MPGEYHEPYWRSPRCEPVSTDSIPGTQSASHSARDRTSSGMSGALGLQERSLIVVHFLNDAIERIAAGARVIALELSRVTDPPDVVARPIVGVIGPAHRASGGRSTAAMASSMEQFDVGPPPML